jgi:hypothetical protein
MEPQVTITRPNTMLGATTLAAISAFGSVATLRKGFGAEAPKPSPEQIKQIGEYTSLHSEVGPWHSRPSHQWSLSWRCIQGNGIAFVFYCTA